MAKNRNRNNLLSFPLFHPQKTPSLLTKCFYLFLDQPEFEPYRMNSKRTNKWIVYCSLIFFLSLTNIHNIYTCFDFMLKELTILVCEFRFLSHLSVCIGYLCLFVCLIHLDVQFFSSVYHLIVVSSISIFQHTLTYTMILLFTWTHLIESFVINFYRWPIFHYELLFIFSFLCVKVLNPYKNDFNHLFIDKMMTIVGSIFLFVCLISIHDSVIKRRNGNIFFLSISLFCFHNP